MIVTCYMCASSLKCVAYMSTNMLQRPIYQITLLNINYIMRWLGEKYHFGIGLSYATQDRC